MMFRRYRMRKKVLAHYESPERFLRDCSDLALAVKKENPFACRNDGLRMDLLVEIAREALGVK